MAKGGARALTLAAGSTEDPIRAVSGDQLTLVSAAATVLGTGATASLQGTAPKIALPIVGNIVDDFAALATVTGPGKVYLDRSSGQVLTAGAENITDYLLSASITSTSASITSIATSNTKQTLALGARQHRRDQCLRDP